MTTTRKDIGKYPETGVLRTAVSHYEIAEKNLRSQIREAHAGGYSLREIAKVVNLSHESVRQIVSADS